MGAVAAAVGEVAVAVGEVVVAVAAPYLIGVVVIYGVAYMVYQVFKPNNMGQVGQNGQDALPIPMGGLAIAMGGQNGQDAPPLNQQIIVQQAQSTEAMINAIAQLSGNQMMIDFIMPKLPQQQEFSKKNYSEVSSLASSDFQHFKESYSCEITKQLMVKPMSCHCGCQYSRRYQRVVIEAWIQQFGRCRFCNKEISLKDIKPDINTEKDITIFKKKLINKNTKRIQQDFWTDQQKRQMEKQVLMKKTNEVRKYEMLKQLKKKWPQKKPHQQKEGEKPEQQKKEKSEIKRRSRSLNKPKQQE